MVSVRTIWLNASIGFGCWRIRCYFEGIQAVLGGSWGELWEGIGPCWVDFMAFKRNQVFDPMLKPEKVVSKSWGGAAGGSGGPNIGEWPTIHGIIDHWIVGIIDHWALKSLNSPRSNKLSRHVVLRARWRIYINIYIYIEYISYYIIWYCIMFYTYVYVYVYPNMYIEHTIL